jgi:hypothetical protein
MDEFTQVKLLRPLVVGGKRRDAGAVVEVSEFDHRLTIQALIDSKSVEPVTGKKKEN